MQYTYRGEMRGHARTWGGERTGGRHGRGVGEDGQRTGWKFFVLAVSVAVSVSVDCWVVVGCAHWLLVGGWWLVVGGWWLVGLDGRLVVVRLVGWMVRWWLVIDLGTLLLYLHARLKPHAGGEDPADLVSGLHLVGRRGIAFSFLFLFFLFLFSFFLSLFSFCSFSFLFLFLFLLYSAHSPSPSPSPSVVLMGKRKGKGRAAGWLVGRMDGWTD
ncbi:hypothetical protein BZA05DRAFT_5951 [Tricharina praecox]|uniref:uncharacterized protein n=1 Tax=Tricharina praecox TaxID=43433 RepID=UPI00221FFF3E|nr:uncharacterized protein BZA05DRAFT_5951 [Tricharina praecox]KAI5858513.1 hypothetical protein BZA05DRAFT_5951 [Tricharina praecox]